MRLGLLLVVTAACGRLSFDGATSSDAPPPACTTDGTPCDDRNVCSAVSECSGGMCLPVGVVPSSCTLARSEVEFDDVQGANSWFYGFYNETVDSDGIYDPQTDFEVAVQKGGLWRPTSWEDMPSPNFTWAYLAEWGGHPASFPQRRATVRRWVSPVSGPATAAVTTRKADTAGGGGDGVRAILVVDGVQRLYREIEGTDADGFTELVPIELATGSTVDLFLHPLGSDSVDTTTQSITIHSR